MSVKKIPGPFFIDRVTGQARTIEKVISTDFVIFQGIVHPFDTLTCAYDAFPTRLAGPFYLVRPVASAWEALREALSSEAHLSQESLDLVARMETVMQERGGMKWLDASAIFRPSLTGDGDKSSSGGDQ